MTALFMKNYRPGAAIVVRRTSLVAPRPALKIYPVKKARVGGLCQRTHRIPGRQLFGGFTQDPCQFCR